MKLHTKIVLLVALVILISGISSSLLGSHFMHKALEEELAKRGVTIAQTLSELIAEDVIKGNRILVGDMLRDIIRQTEGVEFAYITGFDGCVFAHTFEGGFPRALLHKPRKIISSDEPGIDRYLADKIVILELDYPLIEGMRAHIHIGMNEGYIHAQICSMRKRILLLTLIIEFLGIMIGIFLGRCISLPLERLSESMRLFGKGEPEHEIEMHRGAREVVELSRSFNDMIGKRKQVEEALRESEGKLAAMLQSIGDHMSMMDKDLNIIWANETAKKSFGENIIGKKCYEVYHGREKPCDPYPCLTLKAFQDGKTHDHDTQVIGKNGKIVHFHCIANVALRDKDGNPAAVIEISRDITDNKKAEKALRQSEEKSKNLYNNAQVGLFRTRIEDGKLIECNDTFTRLFGYETREGCIADLVASERYVDPDARRQMLDEIKKAGKVENFEALVTRRDGVPFWVSYSATIYPKEGYIEGVMVNVTGRKQAEEALGESEEKYRELVESINEAIYVVDTNGEITYVSPVIEKVAGYSPSEVIGRSFTDFFSQKESQRLMKDFQTCLSGQTVSSEYHLLSGSGEIRWVHTSTRPVFREGHVVALHGVLMDITERRKMQDELAKAHKLESVGVLAGGIAHDFNNMLTGILGNISLARYETNKNTIIETLAEAEKAAMRAKDLTQQLLTFSRGGVPVKKMASIGNLINDSADFVLRGSNVKHSFSISHDVRQVEIDEGQISQVINNLIINADQAMPDGGYIKTGIENVIIGPENPLPLQKGKYVRVSIEDEGTGIPPDHLQRIFDPYFTTKQKGNGLGLAICYSIIKNHNGHIDIESKLGEGTTFYIYLPASEKETAGRRNNEEEKGIISGTGRVLVMDDEEQVRSVAGKMLEQIGYNVAFAKDGAEAIELYKKAKESGAPFDVLIMDLTIPGGMGGKEAIQKLLEIDPEVKAIVASGYSNDPVIAGFREYGFSGFINKPYDIEAISKEIHALIHQTELECVPV